MRCTQIMGLTIHAREWLTENVCHKDIKLCPTCGEEVGGEEIREVYKSAKNEGMFEDGPELYQYDTKYGWYYEVVQAVPWSSGPCIFLCLENSIGQRFFPWSEKEVENV